MPLKYTFLKVKHLFSIPIHPLIPGYRVLSVLDIYWYLRL